MNPLTKYWSEVAFRDEHLVSIALDRRSLPIHCLCDMRLEDESLYPPLNPSKSYGGRHLDSAVSSLPSEGYPAAQTVEFSLENGGPVEGLKFNVKDLFRAC